MRLTYCSVRKLIGACVALMLVIGQVLAEEPEQVLTSIKPLALIAQEITAGSPLKVGYLLSPSVSEHNYALKMSDIKRLHTARLVVWLGDDAEPYLKSTASSWLKAGQADKSLALLHVPQAEHPDEEAADEHSHGMVDPHVWLDPQLAQQLARQIADRLGEIYPRNKQLYDDNWVKFSKTIAALDEDTDKRLNSYRTAPFFVHHDAYGYLVRHYRLNQVGVMRVQPGSALSVKQLRSLQLTLQTQRQTPCLFVEPQLRLSQTAVFSGAAVLTGQLDPLGIDATSYKELIGNLTKNFVGCFEQEGRAGNLEKKKA